MADLGRRNVLISAGAILDTHQAEALPGADPVHAQAFEHPALVGRRLVRLTERTVLGATQVEMNVLGFRPAQSTAVGVGQKRTLGFPAWAFVHHPDKAHFALDLMKDFRKAVAYIRVKPGYATDAFTRLGRELERKVPDFLPTFWEEAGRRFLDEENPKQAAVCFGKARDAERSFGLTVDEGRRGQAYLEFALAGAVTAKSFSAYMKDLQDLFTPEEALERYLKLNIYRVRGGQTPFASLPKELKALAKAARRKAIEVDTLFISQVIDAPQVQSAAASFWKPYAPALKAYAAEGAPQREKVLFCMPNPEQKDADFVYTWLKLFEEIGAIDHWREGNIERAALWLERLGPFIGAVMFEPPVSGEPTSVPAFYRRALEQLAPRLRERGSGLTLSAGTQRWSSRQNYNVDLLEFALRLEIPLTLPKRDSYWSLRTGRSTGYDVERLSEEGEIAPALRSLVAEQLGGEHFEAGVKGKPAYAKLRHACLSARLDALDQGGLIGAEEAIEKLLEHANPQMFEEFPDLRARLQAVRLAPSLRHSLQLGIFDELTWPAYEEVLAEAAQGPSDDLHLDGSAYYPIVRFGRAVVVFHGAEVLRRYDLSLAFDEVRGLFYLAPEPDEPMRGDLWGAFSQNHHSFQAWMSQPEKRLEGTYYYFYGIPYDLPLGGGRVLYGDGAARIGDALGTRYRDSRIAWDGESLYRFEHSYDEPFKAYEVDPNTLENGRAAWPKPMRAASELEDGYRFDSAFLRRAPHGAEGSLLGEREGLVGGWWRVPAGGRSASDLAVCTRVDGRTYRGRRWRDVVFLQMPAAVGLTAVKVRQSTDTDEGDHYTFCCEQSEETLRYSPKALPSIGFRKLPRKEWLHFLRPRDLHLSEKLRMLSVEDAQALLDGAARDCPHFAERGGVIEQALQLVPQEGPAQAWPETIAAIEAHLGAGDATLIGGIAQVVIKTRELELRLHTLIHEQLEASAGAEATKPTDRELFADLPVYPGFTSKEASFYQDLPQIAQYLTGQRAAQDVVLTTEGQPWGHLLDALPLGMAFFVLRPELPEESRQLWRAFIEYYAESCEPFFGARVHLFTLSTPLEGGLFTQRLENDSQLLMQTADGRPAYVRIRSSHHSQGDDQRAYLFDYLVLGEQPPPLPAQAIIARPSESYDVPDDRAQIREILRLYDEHGPVDYALLKPAHAKLLVEDTQLSADGLQWLWAGLPNLRSWQNDFLGAQLRKKLKVNGKAVGLARTLFRARSDAENYRFFAQIMRESAASELWTEEGFESWRSVLRTRWAKPVEEIPAELMSLCRNHLRVSTDLKMLLKVILDLDEGFFTDENLLQPASRTFGGERILRSALWNDFARLLVFLPNALPAGDPVLEKLPALIERLRAFPQENDLVQLRSVSFRDSVQRDLHFSRLVGRLYSVQLDDTEVSCREGGDLLVLNHSSGYFQPYLRFRALSSQETLDQLVREFYGSPRALHDNWAMLGLLFFFGPTPLADTVVARLRDTRVPAGKLASDPRVSVPEVVAQVAAAYEISEDAAALYLLTLTHPDPNKKAIYELLGWKSPVYQAACAALTQAQLLIEAKRAGTGRNHFLPGPWDKNRKGESWKYLFYLAEGTSDNLPYVLPWHVIFERAWARIKAGDIPRFEEATR